METDTSGDRYANTVTRYAAAAIRSLGRSTDRLRLPLPKSTEDRTRELLEALESLPPRPHPGRKNPDAKITPPEQEAVVKLQDFFFSSVVDSVEESQQNRFKCPVSTYTACFAYNEDDTWKVAIQVTSMLAQWSFLLRATALFNAMLESTRGGEPAPE